jgi:carboxypeptidase Taq
MFSKGKSIQDLLDYAREMGDLSAATAILSWDQETYMPPKGATARSHQLSTLSGVIHERLISAKLVELLKNAKPQNEFDQALVREITKLHDNALKLPLQLVKDISKSTSLALESWKKAKSQNKFSIYSSDLENVVNLKIQAANLLKTKDQSTYDQMLNEFEPGLTEDEVSKVFSTLKVQLTNLVKDLAKTTHGADQALSEKKFDHQIQWEMGLKIASDMGYDLEAGRQDKSAHPFTVTFSSSDVRITTWENDDIRPALFATIHEAGHALYEQGIDPQLDRLQIGETGGVGGGTGLAMHESQSRLWENNIGRSAQFWEKYYQEFKKRFKPLADMPITEFVKAINVVKPSFIRVEADEVSYGLHVIARFEIEKDLIGDKIKVGDLPKIWNAKYQELLGITPPDDRFGVLQDIHWSHGAFGYFPTYLLGSLMAAQLMTTAQKQIDIYNLPVLREWLRDNIHRHGRIYTSKELLLQVTGEDLNPKYYIDYLESKFRQLYP